MNYLIKSFHDVNVADFTEGEKEWVNYWAQEKQIIATTPLDAIECYYEKVLYKSFNKGLVLIEENKVYDSYLVDAENDLATQKQIDAWKNKELVLYNENITIKVYKIEAVAI